MNNYSLKRVVAAHIEATLAAFDGNKQKTAKALGIGRATLYRFLKKKETP